VGGFPLPALSVAYRFFLAGEEVFIVELVRSAHSLGEADFHLQFTPKYRCDVFRDGEVRRVCEESFRDTADRYRLRCSRRRVRTGAHLRWRL